MYLGICRKILAVLIVFTAFSANAITGQYNTDSIQSVPGDTVLVEIYSDDPILAAMDSLWADERLNWQNYNGDIECQNVKNFPLDYKPEYSDSIIMARLEVLNKATPLNLDYNRYVKSYISVYVDRRRELTSRVLGLAELYYPLFEEKLDQFNIPLELKHLAVVESALNATARSRVGASGLWQFMYNTGRIYGLEVDSYIDDRSDPYKSTIAACRYMSYLYKIYGDWNMVLAAYNSGPGNVNKAIRRSGGKRTYWEIREYLPRETRSYVPAFIAVNYVMNYAAEHNIYAVTPEFLYSEIDTIHICKETTFDQISHFTGISTAELELLNPSFKRNIIPESTRCRTLYLPLDAAGIFLANEDSLYKFQQPVPQAVDGFVEKDVVSTYTVRRGDVLGVIAQRNGVGLSDLRAWNNIRGNNIHPGQKLEIRKTVKTKVGEETAADKPMPKESINTKASTTSTNSDSNASAATYTVRSGDVLGTIAQRNGVSLSDLKEWNNLSGNTIRPGQKLVTKKTAKANNSEETVASTTGTKSDARTHENQKFHTVQSGDTLWDIAKLYPGISVNDIKSANSNINYSRLKPGQKIKIPPSS